MEIKVGQHEKVNYFHESVKMKFDKRIEKNVLARQEKNFTPSDFDDVVSVSEWEVVAVAVA